MKNILKIKAFAIIFFLNSCGCLLTIVEVDLQNKPFVVNDIIESNLDLEEKGYNYVTKKYRKELAEILSDNDMYSIYVNHSIMQNTGKTVEHKAIISHKGLYQIGDTISLTNKIANKTQKSSYAETNEVINNRKKKTFLTIVETDLPKPFIVNHIKNNADDLVKIRNKSRGYNIPKYIFQSSRYRGEILDILDNEVGLDYEYSLYLNTTIKSKRYPAEHKGILAPKGLFEVGDTISLVKLRKNQ